MFKKKKKKTTLKLIGNSSKHDDVDVLTDKGCHHPCLSV